MQVAEGQDLGTSRSRMQCVCVRACVRACVCVCMCLFVCVCVECVFDMFVAIFVGGVQYCMCGSSVCVVVNDVNM